MAKFLDATGLTYLWGKIKSLVKTSTETMAVEYIVGTQSGETNVWTGATASASLYTGKVIAYKLPFAGTSTAATLNLTLAGGSTTGAKAVKINDSDVTTHFTANSVIVLVYDGTCWRVDNYDSNTNTQMRVYRQNSGYSAAFPLLISRSQAVNIGTAGTNSSYSAIYGVMWDDATKIPTVVPSTGVMEVPGGITANVTGVASKATAANLTTTTNAIATYSNTSGTFATKATANGAAYATAANGALTFGTLPVAQGGTGATTLTSGAALIGAGTGAITTRTITNNTATSSAITANTNLITQNTLRYAINRTTSVAAADTNYTTVMARGISLQSTSTYNTTNGVITLVYE